MALRNVWQHFCVNWRDNMKQLKKLIVVCLLTLVFATMLTGCKSMEARTIEKAINAIGEVTLDSEEAITAAEQMLNNMDASIRAEVENVDVLVDARGTYDALLLEKRIDEIGTITLDSEYTLYQLAGDSADLSSEKKKLVKNYDKLTAALETLNALQEDLTVEEINAFIANLGAVTLENGIDIQNKYEKMNRLDDDAYARITNPDKLINARNRHEALLIDKAIELIGEVSGDGTCGILISNAREQYDAAPAEVQAYVTNYGTLTYAESRYTYLKEIADAERKAKKEAEDAEKAEAERIAEEERKKQPCYGGHVSCRSDFTPCGQTSEGYCTRCCRIANQYR